MLSDIISNHLLMNALLAWATAQLLKFFIYLAVNRTIDWKRLTGDGGMPSGHSATVTALAVTSGLEYGYDSPVFAVCGAGLYRCTGPGVKWLTTGEKDDKIRRYEFKGGCLPPILE